MTNRQALEAFTRVEVRAPYPGDFTIVLPDVVNDNGDSYRKRIVYSGFTMAAQLSVPTEPEDEDFADLLSFLRGKRLVVREIDWEAK